MHVNLPYHIVSYRNNNSNNVFVRVCVRVLCPVKNITVKRYDEVTLSCKASSNVDVKWTQTDPLSYVYIIYSDGKIFENINDRFSIKTTKPSQYDLEMSRANPSDAGRYVCDERNPADGSRTVLSHYFLTVLGNTIIIYLFIR